jgi:hypothetical protein
VLARYKMNRKQLSALLRSHLTRSPNRHIEFGEAIVERLRREQGSAGSRPSRDALDEWLAACLREAEESREGGRPAYDSAEKLAESIEEAERATARADAGDPPALKVAAYRGPGVPAEQDVSVPSEDEMRELVTRILAEVDQQPRKRAADAGRNGRR